MTPKLEFRVTTRRRDESGRVATCKGATLTRLEPS